MLSASMTGLVCAFLALSVMSSIGLGAPGSLSGQDAAGTSNGTVAAGVSVLSPLPDMMSKLSQTVLHAQLLVNVVVLLAVEVVLVSRCRSRFPPL